MPTKPKSEAQPALDDQPAGDEPQPTVEALMRERDRLSAMAEKSAREAAQLRAEKDQADAAAAEAEQQIAVRARTIRDDDRDYRDTGRMTVRLLAALEPLLRERMPAQYIRHLEATTGKPYESTGLVSVQPQVDRMNDVLGTAAWRVLYHYEDQGKVCRTVVIVGNDLHHAKLDSDGNLDAGAADVLLVREGWGGHGRGSNRHDWLKGSETNALKRCLARVGPGAHVYALDFDDHPEMPEPRQRRAPAPQPTPAAQPAPAAERDWSQAVKDLRAIKDDLQPIRVQAIEGMQHLAAPPRQIVKEVEAAQSPRDLKSLLARIDAALAAQSGDAA